VNENYYESIIERKSRVGVLTKVVVLGIFLFFTVFPLFWLFLSSLKDRLDIFTFPPRFFFNPTIENYRGLFVKTFLEGGAGQTDFALCLVNSFIAAGLGTFFAVILGVMAGYACSRFRFFGKNDYLFFTLSTRMLPPVAVIIPIYIMFSRLGLQDTRAGMILLYTMSNLGLAIWIMKGFYDSIPMQYEEAGLVDGYTRWQIFWRIIIPSVKGGIAATMGFCFIFAWNEFTFASIVTTRYAKTLPPRIAAALGAAGLDWGQVAAAGFILIVPVLVLFILIRNYLLMGMTFGVLGRR
jgi:multiple sugar transport system permease protein